MVEALPVWPWTQGHCTGASGIQEPEVCPEGPTLLVGRSRGPLHSFPRAAITKCHRLGNLNNRN